MKFGYARVSKNEQTLDVQVQKLLEAGCHEIFQEKVSGVKDDRPQLQSLLHKLRPGDIVYVVRLDRLGRRMLQLVDLMNDFRQKGIEFVALDNTINTTTPMGMLLFTLCAAFAEMERELIRERVQAGIHAARQKGRRGGRPKSITADKEALLRALVTSDTMSVTQICGAVGITRSVYYRFLDANPILKAQKG